MLVSCQATTLEAGLESACKPLKSDPSSHRTAKPGPRSGRAIWSFIAPNAPPPEIYDLLWSRLLGTEPWDGHGLIALHDDQPAGLAHYYFQRHGWYEEAVVYLQDLYVAPAARGLSLGRRLIEAVYAAADAAGCPRVYWTTEADNAVGRRLYDRIGELTPFIKYQRTV